MGNDTRDYTRPIDIVLQALAKQFVNLRNGTPFRMSFIGAVAPNFTFPLIEAQGAGVFYGGYATVTSSASQKNDNISFVIDGITYPFPSFQTMLDNGNFGGNDIIGGLACFDETNFIYTLKFGFGITFETSFLIQYTETHGRFATMNLNALATVI